MSNILVFSHNPFSKVSNNGKTLSSIFSGVDPKSLSQLYISTREVPDGDQGCTAYFLISDIDLFRSFFTGRGFGVSVNPQSSSSVQSNEMSQRERRPILSKNPLTIWIRELLWMFLFPIKRGKVSSWVEEQSPDVLFYVAGDAIFSMKIALWISRITQIPLITFVTDDYYLHNRPRLSSFFDFTHCYVLRRAFRRLLSKSTKCYVISEKMKSEYDQEFHINSEVLINTIESVPFQPYVRDGKNIKLGYFGNLALGRDEMLLDLGKILMRICADNSVDAELHIYTFSRVTPNLLSQFNKNDVILHSGLSSDQLRSAMYQCDFFVLVENPDPKFFKLTRLSLSTKVPEYMMMSRPVLAYGPVGSGSMDFIRQYKCGIYMSTESSFEDKVCLLREVLLDTDLSSGLALKAYNVASEYFNRERQSAEFLDCLNRLNNNERF